MGKVTRLRGRKGMGRMRSRLQLPVLAISERGFDGKKQFRTFEWLWKEKWPFIVRSPKDQLASPNEPGCSKFTQTVEELCKLFAISQFEVRLAQGRKGIVGNQSGVVSMSAEEFLEIGEFGSFYAAQNIIFKIKKQIAIHSQISDVSLGKRDSISKTKLANRESLKSFCSTLNSLITEVRPGRSRLQKRGSSLALLILKHLKQQKPDLRVANIWINQKHASSQVHYDLYDNFLNVIEGRKRVLLLPPETKSVKSAQDGNYHEGRFKRLGGKLRINKILDSEPKATYSILEPGDILRIPEGWYHYVCSDPYTCAINIWYKSVLETLPKTPILRHLVETSLQSQKKSLLSKHSPFPTLKRKSQGYNILLS